MQTDVSEIPGIPYQFKDPDLLVQALTHRSRGKVNYERLEFLGDSILNLVVSRRLFDLREDDREGSLSRLRSMVVRGETLAGLASEIGLGDHLIMGQGELQSGGFLRKSILADAMESILGAIYLDGGFEACEGVIHLIFDPVIQALPDAEDLKDPKTRLQEWLQARGRPLPQYDLVREEGADHEKRFYVSCKLPDDGAEQISMGNSRRKAEQAAAQAVYEYCQENAA